MAKPIRRIVTGHNAEGRSIVLMDGPAPDVIVNPTIPTMASTLLWLTDRAPASNQGDADAAPAGLRVPTPPQHRGGSVFRISELPPDSTIDTSKFDMRTNGVELSEERTKVHYRFHRTNTVDYAICLEGEVWAMMDEGEVLMKQGDVLIQRGTYHSWANRSDKLCRMAFILIDAEPL